MAQVVGKRFGRAGGKSPEGIELEHEKLRVKEKLGTGREEGLNQRLGQNWQNRNDDREDRQGHEKLIEQARIDSREGLAGLEASLRKGLRESTDRAAMKRLVTATRARILMERSKKDSWFDKTDGAAAVKKLEDQLTELEEAL
jgi:hypothetical protein